MRRKRGCSLHIQCLLSLLTFASVGSGSIGVAAQDKNLTTTGTPTATSASPSTSPSPSARDCSYLSGRELSDCECRRAFAGAKRAWSEGDAALAVRLMDEGMCSESSPGLNPSERRFVGVAKKAWEKIAHAKELGSEGKYREAAYLWGKVYKEATREHHMEHWLSVGYCTSLGSLLAAEADLSDQSNANLVGFAPMVLTVCAEAQDAAGNNSSSSSGGHGSRGAHATWQVSSSAGGDRGGAVGSAARAYRNELEACGGAVGVQVQMLNIMGKHEEAIEVAVKYGFRLYVPVRTRNNNSSSSSSSDACGSSSGTSGCDNVDEDDDGLSRGNETKGRPLPNVWRGVAALMDEARWAARLGRVHIDLPHATPIYSSELALSLASVCMRRHDSTGRVGQPVFDSIRRVLRLDPSAEGRRKCLAQARLVDRGGAMRAEAAETFGKGEYGDFLPIADQVIASSQAGVGVSLARHVHAVMSRFAVGRAISFVIRRIAGGQWPSGWLDGAAKRARNGRLLLSRLKALLAVGDLAGAKHTAVALASMPGHTFGGRGEEGGAQISDCVPLIDVAVIAQDLLAMSFDLLGEKEEEERLALSRRALAVLEAASGSWGKCPLIELIAVSYRIKANAIAALVVGCVGGDECKALREQCKKHATRSISVLETQLGFEALGDCMRTQGDRGLAFRAYLSSFAISLKTKEAHRRPFSTANLFARKIVGSVVGDAADLILTASSVLGRSVIVGGMFTVELVCMLAHLGERHAYLMFLKARRELRRQAKWISENGREKAQEFARKLMAELAALRKDWERARQEGGFGSGGGGSGGQHQRRSEGNGRRNSRGSRGGRQQQKHQESEGSGGRRGTDKNGSCRRSFKGLSDFEVLKVFGARGGRSRCNQKEVRKTYHKLSLEHHPDKATKKGVSAQCASDNFIDLQEAYERAKSLC